MTAINSDIRALAGRRPLFHLPPTINGTAGLLRRKVNGHKRSSGARGVRGGSDKTFSESGVFFSFFFFLWVSSELTTRRDKVIGSRGQTVDLSPHGCAVICCAVGSGLARRRRAPPHRDNDYFRRGAMFLER